MRVSSHHRVEMCRLLTSTSDWLSVSTWESENPKWTPTVLSVEYHAEKAKNEFDAGLRLLGRVFLFFNHVSKANFCFQLAQISWNHFLYLVSGQMRMSNG